MVLHDTWGKALASPFRVAREDAGDYQVNHRKGRTWSCKLEDSLPDLYIAAQMLDFRSS